MENSEVEYRLNELDKRIEKLELKVEETDKTLHEFDKTQSLIIQKLDALMETVESIKNHQELTAQKPAATWDKVKWAIISTVITASVTSIIAYIVRWKVW